ncbi:MAG: hypothetical protein K2X82_03625, partial [Gemmataceae bacterium]|nr:hypothetical protein [Gemmataceae bacterium]
MSRRSLTSWLPAPKRTRRSRPWLGIEVLEDRIVPDGTLPPDLVVGRTLSAYTVAGVQNRTLDVTYTVYNQRADDLSGVLLTTALQPGVTYKSATAVPDRSGSELAWSLGTVRGFDRASVTVTVALPETPPLQIDSGAKAFATVNAGAVSADTPAAALTSRTIAPELLASTVDANTADPFVQEQAAKLRYDPQRIVQYLSTDVGYESYTGSLRGSRGTLWSAAGNALDEASLGVALLRASGVPARYARGTLSDDLSKQLILSMFPPALRTVGTVAPGVPTADPANDPQLLAEARDHYWVQLDTGGGFVSADTSGLPGGGLGAALTAVSDTFAEVADALRAKTRVTLTAETYRQVAAAFGVDPFGRAVVLDQTFNDVELVGKPLSVGSLADSVAGGFVFVSRTNTYTPYLRVGDEAYPPERDRMILGQQYQDILTNFPLGTQVVTGVFLDVTLSGPGAATETYRRAIADRLGPAARAGVGGTVTADPNGPPLVNDTDVTTLYVQPGRGGPRTFAADLLAGYGRLYDRIAQFPDGEPLPPAQQTEFRAVLRNGFTLQTRVYGSGFLAYSDALTDELQARSLVRAYFDSPRLVVVASRVTVDPAARTASPSFETDLRRDRVRALAYPGQAAAAAGLLNGIRGYLESYAEQDAQQRLRPAQDAQTRGVSAFSVLEAARAQNVPVVTLTGAAPAALDALAISADAKALISLALARGLEVRVPARPVDVAGGPAVAWYTADPATGEVVGVLEDGSHGFFNQASLNAQTSNNITFLFWVAVIGLGAPCLIYGVQKKNCIVEFGNYVGGLAGQLPKNPQGLFGAIAEAFAKAKHALTSTAIKNNPSWGHALAGIDPPVGDFLFGGRPSPGFADLGAGQTAGAATGVVPDPLFTVPFRGAELPTGFRIGVKDLEAVPHTFALDVSGLPAGFTAVTSVPRVTVGPGQTGEVGLYLIPTAGSAPAPGTVLAFAVTATSTTDPTITRTQAVTFTVPEVPAVSLTASPEAVGLFPGGSVAATLTVRNVGNVAHTVALSAAPSAGLTVAGLPPTLTLNPGEEAALAVDLTVADTVPLNSTLAATFTAAFGPAASPLTQTLELPVRVAAPGADAAVSAAVTAGRLGNPGLAARLDDLATALTNLVQYPASRVYKGQAVAALDAIVGLAGADPYLAPAVAAVLANDRDGLANATGADAVRDAIVTLGVDLEAVDRVLAAAAAHGFTLELSPNTATALPGAPARYEVLLRNTGSETTTYDLTVVGLPAGVTAAFTRSAVTLRPGEAAAGGSDPVLLELTQPAGSVVPATFTVTATAREAQGITRSLGGTLTVRSEFVSVPSVATTPAFADAGGPVAVSARLLNAVNRPRTVRAAFTVTAPGGSVVFTSAPVDVALTTQTPLVTADLGSFDATGLAAGDYAVAVTVTEPDGTPVPGGTGQARFLVGSPVTAGLAVGPANVLPGTAAVTNTLTLTARTAFTPPFALVGRVATTPTSTTLVIRGPLAYVAGTDGVDIVDVSDPANPARRSTFATDRIVRGGYTVVRELPGDRIVVGSTTTFNAQGTRLLVFSVADPLAPALVSDTQVNEAFMSDFLVSGSTALLTTQGAFLYGSAAAGDLFDQFGDVTAIDLDAAGGPAITDRLFGTRNPPFTGDSPQSGGAVAAPGRAYVVGTSAAGGNLTTGTGRLRVVDFADRADLKLVRSVDVPGTFRLYQVAVDGNRALVVGTTRADQDPYDNTDADPANDTGTTGNLTLTTLDVSDPDNPVVLATVVTAATFPRGSAFPVTKQAVVALGGGKFAVSLGIAGGSPVLFLVDAAAPAAPAVAALPVTAVVNEMTAAGGRLYTTSADGLTVYDVGAVDTLPVTASVRVPNGTGVAVVPGSFNVPPTRVISGTDFDTLEWDRRLGSGLATDTLTWQTTVTGLAPGEARAVTSGGSVAFTQNGTAGQAALAPTAVTAASVVGLTPDARTVRPGSPATYTVTLANPTAGTVAYSLTVGGVPPEWADYPGLVYVAANGTESVTLRLTPDAVAAPADYGFVVRAETGNGPAGFVQGTLTVAGEVDTPRPDAYGVVVRLTPARATAGQGTPAVFTVRLTNTGSATETMTLDVTQAPGVLAAFVLDGRQVDVPPGAGNFREVLLTVTPAPGTAAGDVPVTVTAYSRGGPSTATGTVTVVNRGVSVALDRAAGAPGEAFTATVTNTGAAADTFDLAAGGPAGLVAALGDRVVSLAPGESKAVTVTTTPAAFAAQGALGLAV